MARGKAFVDVLDQALDGFEPSGAAAARRSAVGCATPSIFFLFETGIRHDSGGLPPEGGSHRHQPQGGSHHAPSGIGSHHVASGFTRKAPRTLTDRQRQALDAFTSLGGSLGDDFTNADLKRAFRLLALRYHPDRHPASSDGERARLSARFAQLHDAYEHLQAASRN